MYILVPKEVNIVIETLQENSYEAYIVGGCVRDSIIKREIYDWDIATSAPPEKIMHIFHRTVPTGIKHGTVTVIINNLSMEVTTFRIDGSYSDGRHPDHIKYTESIIEDLSRRDFTINAMAFNHDSGIIDPFFGKKHINNKVISCVGEPDLRFTEDALRMMRAIRFSAQLDFEIEEKTFNSIINNCHLIKKVSWERIRDELCKIIASNNPSKGIKLMSASGLLKFIIPELEECVNFDQRNPHHDKSLFEHILSVVDNCDNDLKLRLSALFHDIGKPLTFSIDSRGIGHFYNHDLIGAITTKEILERLKFDNGITKDVCLLVDSHLTAYSAMNEKKIKKLIIKLGRENILDLFQLQTADTKGHAPPHDFSIIMKNKENTMKILSEKQPLSIKDLKINGRDLITLGFTEGKEIGRELNKLMELVLENPDLNKKEILLSLIEKA